jgi:hypothetical protein
MDTTARDRAKKLSNEGQCRIAEYRARVEAATPDVVKDAGGVQALRYRVGECELALESLRSAPQVSPTRSPSDEALLARLEIDKDRAALALGEAAARRDRAHASRDEEYDAAEASAATAELAAARSALERLHRSRPLEPRALSDDETSRCAVSIERARAELVAVPDRTAVPLPPDPAILADLAEWEAFVAGVRARLAGESLEDVRARLTAVRAAKGAAAERFGVASELSELSGYTFSEDCEACRSNPTNARLRSLKRRAAELDGVIASTSEESVETLEQTLRDAELVAFREPSMLMAQARFESETRAYETAVALRERELALAKRVEAEQRRARTAAIEKADANLASARLIHDAASAELAATCDRVDTTVAAAKREALSSRRSDEERLMERLSSLRARVASAEDLIDARESLATAEIAVRYRDLVAAEARYAEACEGVKAAERAIADADEARKAWALHAAKAAELAAAESGIRASLAKVEAVRDAFMGGGSTGRGVRGELYEAHILPLFCSVANEFLDGIHSMRLGHVGGDLVISKRGRGDDPYKSSGYQQFCV